jgi:hypothetical protein
VCGGRTPEELESLLEDAVVLRDASATAALFELDGVLVAGSRAATGRLDVARATHRLGGYGYVADPRRVLHGSGLALVVGPRSVTVARRGVDEMWRYAFAVFVDASTDVGSCSRCRLLADARTIGERPLAQQ